MTPYTSYLVLEDDEAYKQHGIDRYVPLDGVAELEERAVRRFAAKEPGLSPSSPAVEAVPVFDESAAEALSAATAPAERKRLRAVGGSTGEIKSYLKADSGTEAIDLSRAIARYKHETVLGRDLTSVRHVGQRLFYRIEEQWVDSSYKAEMKTRRITFASDAYFELLADHPELKPCLALGQRVIVVLGDTAIMIEAGG